MIVIFTCCTWTGMRCRYTYRVIFSMRMTFFRTCWMGLGTLGKVIIFNFLTSWSVEMWIPYDIPASLCHKCTQRCYMRVLCRGGLEIMICLSPDCNASKYSTLQTSKSSFRTLRYTILSNKHHYELQSITGIPVIN